MMDCGENSKRKKSTDSEESNSQKKRKTVSPVKSHKFNALDYCRKICTEFRTDPKHMKYAQFFLTPVDPVALHCPTYFEIIKRPMDLSTIQKKLENNEYSSEDDFAFDFRLMFENCYTFNGRDHQIAPYCKMFQDAFEEKFSRIKKLQAKSKFTLLDKIRRAKDTVLRDIGKYELILADLKEKLECIKQQEKDEEMRINQPDDFMPKEKKKNSVKRAKSKPINPFIEINVPKVKNKQRKDGAKKLTKTNSKSKSKVKPLQMLELPPPLPTQQTKTDPILKSDSEEDDTAPSMTYEEMRNLSAAINLLPAEKVIEILDIIKKYQPKEAEAGEDELEIEFQNLKPVTLRALEKFIKDYNKPKPAPKQQSRGKTMQIEDAKELEKQRQEIQNQLNSIDDQLGMAPKKKPPPPPPPSPKDKSSSSDSDSDDSSSSDPSSESLASSSSDSE